MSTTLLQGRGAHWRWVKPECCSQAQILSGPNIVRPKYCQPQGRFPNKEVARAVFSSPGLREAVRTAGAQVHCTQLQDTAEPCSSLHFWYINYLAQCTVQCFTLYAFISLLSVTQNYIALQHALLQWIYIMKQLLSATVKNLPSHSKNYPLLSCKSFSQLLVGAGLELWYLADPGEARGC